MCAEAPALIYVCVCVCRSVCPRALISHGVISVAPCSLRGQVPEPNSQSGHFFKFSESDCKSNATHNRTLIKLQASDKAWWKCHWAKPRLPELWRWSNIRTADPEDCTQEEQNQLGGWTETRPRCFLCWMTCFSQLMTSWRSGNQVTEWWTRQHLLSFIIRW